MHRIIKTPYFYSVLLAIIFAASSFSSVQGWCIESRSENIGSHIALSDCHSKFTICDDTILFNALTTHATDRNGCTTCYDIEFAIIAAKLVNDPTGSLVAPPPINNIVFPQQYSDHKTFSIASPGDRLAIDQSSTRQTLQNSIIRTVVLLM